MGDLRGIGQVFVCWKENGCPGYPIEEIFRRGEINFALFSFYMYTVLSIGGEVGERERGHGLGQILQLETRAIDWDRLVSMVTLCHSIIDGRDC